MLKINWREYYEYTVIPSVVLACASVLGKSAIDGAMVPELFPFLFLFFLAVITLNEGYDRITSLRMERVSTTPNKN